MLSGRLSRFRASFEKPFNVIPELSQQVEGQFIGALTKKVCFFCNISVRYGLQLTDHVMKR
ncbi:MAG: hypothetical protein CL917_01965 [Deltaproteobacteria bacterium]|nr:hypothetical protein [Deltaproteobacteria bacterium]